MARPSMDGDKERLIEKLKLSEGAQGNQSLRTSLGWNEDRYWRVHGALADEGLIIRGRGKGGSVSLSAIEGANDPIVESKFEQPTTLEQEVEKEAALYDPAKNVIEQTWVRERSFDDHLVEVTASPGRRNTGGTWTRPDVSVLATKAYPFLPERIFEIITFEVKNVNSIDVLGVFEALSHAQFASLSYVLFCTQGRDFDADFTDTRRVISLANEHGVGLIIANDINQYSSWDERVRPRRKLPDPEQANLFISTCFSEAAKQRVIKWHK